MVFESAFSIFRSVDEREERSVVPDRNRVGRIFLRVSRAAWYELSQTLSSNIHKSFRFLGIYHRVAHTVDWISHIVNAAA